MHHKEQLKKRINESKFIGVETAHIRDDYEPIGQKLIQQLCENGEYVQRRFPMCSVDSKWRIYKTKCKHF